jgi:hypothetical protein
MRKLSELRLILLPPAEAFFTSVEILALEELFSHAKSANLVEKSPSFRTDQGSLEQRSPRSADPSKLFRYRGIQDLREEILVQVGEGAEGEGTQD